MQQITRTKVIKGTIELPRSMREEWQNKEVILFPEGGRIIVQKIEEGWDTYEEKLRKGSRKISSQLIDDAVAWAKKQ